MGRTRSSRRDEALRQYMKSQGKAKPKEIAEFLKVEASTVRKWKVLDKWDEILALPPEKRNIPKKVGAPFGSQNAKGHKGHGGNIGNKGGKGGPYGNRNAYKTGYYANISLDTLSDEEKALYDSIPGDPMVLIDENIRLLKIRERRMLDNQNKLKTEKDALVVEEVHIVYEQGEDSPSRREVTRKKQLLIDKLTLVDDAITKVQEKLLKAIESKQKMMIEQAEKVGGQHDTIQFTFNR